MRWDHPWIVNARAAYRQCIRHYVVMSYAGWSAYERRTPGWEFGLYAKTAFPICIRQQIPFLDCFLCLTEISRLNRPPSPTLTFKNPLQTERIITFSYAFLLMIEHFFLFFGLGILFYHFFVSSKPGVPQQTVEVDIDDPDHATPIRRSSKCPNKLLDDVDGVQTMDKLFSYVLCWCGMMRVTLILWWNDGFWVVFDVCFFRL